MAPRTGTIWTWTASQPRRRPLQVIDCNFFQNINIFVMQERLVPASCHPMLINSRQFYWRSRRIILISPKLVSLESVFYCRSIINHKISPEIWCIKSIRLLWCPWWSTWDLMGKLTARRKNNARIRSIMWAWSCVSWWP